MRLFKLHSRLWLPKRLPQVFGFFADASNLERITPPWLKFELRDPNPIDVRKGVLIDYRLRLRGVPISWQSEITTWDPPHRFVDEQRRGPYRVWTHEHRFTERGGQTLAEDIVSYAVPGGWIAERLLVRRDLEKIFKYRRATLRDIFGETQGPDGMADGR